MKSTRAEKESRVRLRSIYLFNIILMSVISLVSLCGLLIMIFLPDTYTRRDVEEAGEEARARVLDSLKTDLERSGDPLEAIRSQYGDYLVVAQNDSYNFYRILDSVPLTDYDQKGFYRDEDGRLAYRDDSGRYSETGLTVTEANGTIDWGTVSDQSIDYAFISMGRYNSEKYLIEDSRWVENLAAASEAGLDAGLRVSVKIHDKESGKEQGREVIQRLQDRAPDFRGTVAVLVAEDYGRASEEQTERTTSGVVAFCRALDNAGYTPVVAGDLLNLCGLLDLTRLKNYDKWISDYGNVPYYPYEFTYWDYGKGSQINGIDGRVFLSMRIRDAS